MCRFLDVRPPRLVLVRSRSFRDGRGLSLIVLVRVLCANRDEVLDRPTLPASWHDFTVVGGSHNPSARSTGAPASTDTGSVLSGIDVQAGGTWMGINRAGRIALM